MSALVFLRHPCWVRLIAHRQLAADQNGMMGSMMQDLAFAIPGVDEAMSFAEIMKYVTIPASLFDPPNVLIRVGL